ncbi:DUF1682-domain-containing protein [Melanomma pulvis-pyrius CBS 109.77]|uniref:DUF1682-domain-containing protein n=1 Tax=Melanomma pulvis-pyrius CBS 109.77 TaxID=1314802 RepID=A0A6A6X9N1_9PLEO|nr:DUF1682-domain-containing protein [Melanomma pulvis-pyrius CBS 109.77]
MADFVKGLFGNQKPAQVPSAGDDDFADFAGAPDPTPAGMSPFTTTAAPSPFQTSTVGQVPYTAWYRVWERVTINDFKLELYILPFVLLVVVLHLWGTRKNRKIATRWIKAHAPLLQQEFSQVGYLRGQPSGDADSVQALADASKIENMLREKKADEYMTYATGRQNVAFIDFKLTLAKRYNPLMRFGETAISLFFESFPVPQERLEATSYVFDGREAQIVPNYGKGEGKKSVPNSSFDGFVFAILHKDLMKRLREDRYDLSLTATKDHAKLPIWTTVMSENAEITETLLTPELIKAINDAGDNFEALVVSDQPMDQPKKLDDTIPRKRINLSIKLDTSGNAFASTIPLFQYFLRMPDHLVSAGHFRAEAMRRIKQTREDQIAKIRRLDDDEKAEERKLQGDKAKKEKRDQMLGRMNADEQRKYLEKERERDTKRREKKKTVKA